MTRLFRHLTPFAQAMLAGILVLAGLIVLEAAVLDFGAVSAAADGSEPQQVDAGLASAAPRFDAVTIPPLPAYRDLAARPLFMDTRRPAPRQGREQVAQRVDPATKWKLTGIILAGEGSHVVLQGVRDKTIRRLEVGQTLDGWVVSDITPQHVRLTAGDQEATLELRKDTDER